MKHSLRTAALAAALAGSSLLQACFPLAATAVVGGSLMAADRRTAATQAVDAEIELKSMNFMKDALNGAGHINVNAYNREVLLTGEVPTEEDKKRAEQAAGQIVNVKSVVNELGVMGNSSLTSRSNDALITAKVKTSLFDAKDVFAGTIHITTERGTVYLQGIVTQREADRAADIASRVGGVEKVVKVFDIVSEDDLKRLSNDAATQPPSTPPAQPPAAPMPARPASAS